MSSLTLRKIKARSVWDKGYDWIIRVGKSCKYEYSVRECRIAAMAFEAGWKSAKRDANKNAKQGEKK